MALHVDRVWLRTPDGGEVLTPISQVQANDLICVRTGNLIPLDGKVVEGAATVNQASLTGESVPADKGPGSMVYADTVVEDGEFVVQVSGSTGTSQYDRIVSMIEESENLKSNLEKQASRLADRLVPYVLAGSVLTYALTRNITRAVAILMVDFSCALKLSIPLSVLSAMREAGRCHISVKGGKYLESVARADTVVFDKTGTLTHACPMVVQVVPFGGHDKTEMLRVAACLEEYYPHSIANAVVRAAQEQNLDHQEMHAKVEYVVAHGISSTIGEDRIVIGSHHFVFEDEDCSLPKEEQKKFDELPEEYSHLYLAIGGVLSAVICIADPLRPEAAEAIRQLRALGISHVVMMMGDSERTAAAIARQIGVDAYDSEVLPADKANFVKEWQAKGHSVMMVGDGINDSPALSAANVGISISDGAAIAREIADINIAADSLLELAVLHRLSLALIQRIDSNYRTIIGFNSSLIALGALGILAPSTSALLHNLSTLLISLNSMTDLLEEREPSLLESDF